MTLDEQLRAALSQEADMQTVPRPDVDELISGGRVRRRRRNQGRIGSQPPSRFSLPVARTPSR